MDLDELKELIANSDGDQKKNLQKEIELYKDDARFLPLAKKVVASTNGPAGAIEMLTAWAASAIERKVADDPRGAIYVALRVFNCVYGIALHGAMKNGLMTIDSDSLDEGLRESLGTKSKPRGGW